jgi:putative permease
MDANLTLSLRRESRIKLASVLAILLGCGIVLFAVDNLLISFVLAFVTNYLLSPIVDWLESKRLPRQAAIMIPFIATGALLAFGIYMVVPRVNQQIETLGSQLPKYQADLMNLVSGTEQRFKLFFKLYNINFSQAINDWIIHKSHLLSDVLPSIVSGSITVLILTPFFAYFMLQDGRRLTRALMSLVPNSLFEIALDLQHRLNDQMGGFIRARFLEAAIVGFVVWIGLRVTGFPYATLLAIFAGLTNLIPYLGPLIGAVPAILIALISEDGMIAATMSLNLIVVTSIYFFAQLVDIVFIIPFVVAKIVNLHPVTVVIVIIIGSQIMGILGMMISIPIASAIKLVFQTFYRHLTEAR